MEVFRALINAGHLMCSVNNTASAQFLCRASAQQMFEGRRKHLDFVRLSLRGHYNDVFRGCFWAYLKKKKSIHVLSKVLCAVFFP